MKILAINASYRGDQGYTRFLVDKLLAGAGAAGAECEVVTLAHKKINRCLACDKCQQSGKNYLICVQRDKDDVQDIFRKMASSDLIIFGTPVYVVGISVLLKMLLDRQYGTADCGKLIISKSGLIFHESDRKISGKPIVALICCDNIEDETPRSLIQYFKDYAKFLDVPLAGVLVRNAGRAAGHGKDKMREQFFPKLAQVYKAFEQAGRELATQGYISKATQRKANQEIVPMKNFKRLKKTMPYKEQILQHARTQMILAEASSAPDKT
ncbi:MAG: flavodoxin family protein [Deltaproteobacteria bacterium]|nr:flavodoxin family protein [Deltaproteobacteria bacterium]